MGTYSVEACVVWRGNNPDEIPKRHGRVAADRIYGPLPLLCRRRSISPDGWTERNQGRNLFLQQVPPLSPSHRLRIQVPMRPLPSCKSGQSKRLTAETLSDRVACDIPRISTRPPKNIS